ncbi:hypothetical protein CPC08DRAFT_331860 [Agrocybe pediades]|nr:hypothetical protein CPC08DRAFT_331860 [Agrocybe pediades]
MLYEPVNSVAQEGAAERRTWKLGVVAVRRGSNMVSRCDNAQSRFHLCSFHSHFPSSCTCPSRRPTTGQQRILYFLLLFLYPLPFLLLFPSILSFRHICVHASHLFNDLFFLTGITFAYSCSTRVSKSPLARPITLSSFNSTTPPPPSHWTRRPLSSSLSFDIDSVVIFGVFPRLNDPNRLP